MAPGILSCESKLNPIELIWEKKDHIMSPQLVFTKHRQRLGKNSSEKRQFLTPSFGLHEVCIQNQVQETAETEV